MRSVRQRGLRLGDARVRGRLRHRRGARTTCARRSTSPRPSCPQDTDEPFVKEVNLALFPVLVVTLAGDVPERTLLGARARPASDRIEGLANVLEVEIAGEREELLEIIIDPLLVESYGLRHRGAAGARRRATTGWSRRARSTPARAGSRSRCRACSRPPTTSWTCRSRPTATGSSALRRHRRRCGAPSRTRRASPASTAGRRSRSRSASASARTSSRPSSRCARWSRPSARSWPPDVEVGYLQDKSDDIREHADRPAEQRADGDRCW